MCKQYLRSYVSFVAISALWFGLISTQVAAFAPQWVIDQDDLDGTDPVGGVVIWHAGGNVSTSSMQAAVIDALCNSLVNYYPIDILEDARSYIIPPNPNGATDMEKAGVARPAFWSVACTGAGGSLSGKKLIWNTREEGGSGVGPLALGKPIGFMKPSTPDFTTDKYLIAWRPNCPGNDGTSGPTGTNNYTRTILLPGGYTVNATVWNCVNFTYNLAGGIGATFHEGTSYGTGVMRVPDIGTSDIEPDKFTTAFSFNVPASDFDLDGVRGPTDTDDILAPHDATGLVRIGLVKEDEAQLIFGVPVNVLMYQDLQRAQFPSGHPLFNDCNPAGSNYGSITTSGFNANQEKCMPSLTANEIRSIFTKGGAIRSSKDFQTEIPYGSGTYAELTATTNGATDNTIHICRYANGLGAQAQTNAIFLGYPCDATIDSGIDTLVPEAESALTTFVTENQSSTDIEKCLNDFNNGTNDSGKNNVPAGCTAGNCRKRWAIGIQSADKNAPSGAGAYSNAYRFIKIDGYAPTLVNAHAGDYFDVAQQSLQYKSGAPTVTVDAFTALKPYIQDPLKLPALNKVHSFGTSGWLATPSATVTPDSELSFTRPVAWFRRVSSNGVANTCTFPSAFRKSGVPGIDITVGPTNCSAGANTDGDQNCYTP